MPSDMRSNDGVSALDVARDTDVSGRVFRVRTEPAVRERLLAVTRDHRRDHHGKDYGLAEIDERHVNEVDATPGVETE